MDRPNPFPVRRVGDRPWEVFIIEPPQERWIECECEADARLVASAPQARFDSLAGMRSGAEFAQELQTLADVLARYRMSAAARYFRQRAVIARENGAAAGA